MIILHAYVNFGGSMIETFDLAFEEIKCGKCRKIHRDIAQIEMSCMRNKKILREEVEEFLKVFFEIEFEKLELDSQKNVIRFLLPGTNFFSVEVGGFLF